MLLAERVLGGGGLKSRLVDRLRQQDGISYAAGSYLSVSAFEENGWLDFSASFAPQNRDKLQTDVAEVVAALLRDGVTEQELAAAKKGMLESRRIARTSDGGLAGTLQGQLYTGRTYAYAAQTDKAIEAATVEAVNAALRKYVDPSHLVESVAGDFAGAKARQSEAATGQ
jgi:zinc protease